MQQAEHVRLMATYNEWMNEKIYAAASQLSAEELSKDRGAFFKSIFGTLNHIAVADTFWLKRFADFLPNHAVINSIFALPQPNALDSILFTDITALSEHRKIIDKIFLTLAESITDDELNVGVNYKNLKGVASTKNLFSLLMHVFNHQTHHRGQVTTLLSQSGIDVGVTDLVVLIPNI